MFCFGFCFTQEAEAMNSSMTDWRSSELIGYQIVHAKLLCSVNNKASICQNVLAFSFNSIGYVFIYLSGSPIEKILRNLL